MPLSNYIKIKHGYAFKGDYISYVDNSLVLVTPGNFCIEGGFKEDKCKYYSGPIKNEYILKPGDLVVTMTDLSKGIDTLGYSALIPKSLDKKTYLHNQRIGLIQFINQDLPFEYIYWFMRSKEYQLQVAATSTGTTVHHTSPAKILSIDIPIPLESDNQILKYLSPITELISRNNNESTVLRIIRNKLLPKLLTGEIEFK